MAENPLLVDRDVTVVAVAVMAMEASAPRVLVLLGRCVGLREAVDEAGMRDFFGLLRGLRRSLSDVNIFS
jgi:hypothetical protein